MKRLCQICIGIFAFAVAAEVAVIVSIVIFVSNIAFVLNGNEDITINYGDTYYDEGVTATTINWDLSDYVSTEQAVDTSHVGVYYISYHLDFLNHHYLLRREINVVDTAPPTITLSGEPEVKMYVDDEYTDAGATATDDYDGDITSKIITNSTLDTTQEGEYEVSYFVEDSSGNTATATRKIIVEKKPEPVVAYVAEYGDDGPYVPYTADDPIASFIAARGYDVSVGYYNLVTGKNYFYQPERIYYGASLIKTLDAIYLYDKNMVNEDLKYYIDRAVLASDNNAHRYLVDYIGRENLKEYGIGLGAANTLSGEGNYGDTTVIDQLVYYKKAYELALQNEDFKAPFVNNSYNYIAVNGLAAMHKNGYYDIWFHDAGIVFDDEPYIVIILTNHGRGSQYETVHSLAEQVYKYHKGLL